MQQNTVVDIRHELALLLQEKAFTSVNREGAMTALTGNTTIEIVGANFIADDEAIFGELNHDYIDRETAWYESTNRSVDAIPGGAPQIWKTVADKDGLINSNYGWCIHSPQNGFMPDIGVTKPHTPEEHGYIENLMMSWSTQFQDVAQIIDRQTMSQYKCARAELQKNPESRRAVMIYTRPQMWLDFDLNGRSDFMCTNAVQYLIRDGALHAIVQMRSNDAIFGFKNDRAWQQHVLERLADDLNVDAGDLYWNAGSLHVYERHYFLVDHYLQTGETTITKAVYDALYPGSPYASKK